MVNARTYNHPKLSFRNKLLCVKFAVHLYTAVQQATSYIVS